MELAEMPKIAVDKGDALIIVDVQNDFLPGGALPAPKGEKVLSPLNDYIALFEKRNLPVVATRDWHPPDHCSFTEQGGPWPPHCVRDSGGAAFAGQLELPGNVIVISKAGARDEEAYSAFEGTGLEKRLRDLQVERVFVGGLATDYCVLNTVKDALSHSFQVYLLQDAIQAVNVQPEDGYKAEAEMKRLGAIPVRREDLE
jgi:nicotinamidase-related amidase